MEHQRRMNFTIVWLTWIVNMLFHKCLVQIQPLLSLSAWNGRDQFKMAATFTHPSSLQVPNNFIFDLSHLFPLPAVSAIQKFVIRSLKRGNWAGVQAVSLPTACGSVCMCVSEDVCVSIGANTYFFKPFPFQQWTCNVLGWTVAWSAVDLYRRAICWTVDRMQYLEDGPGFGRCSQVMQLSESHQVILSKQLDKISERFCWNELWSSFALSSAIKR